LIQSLFRFVQTQFNLKIKCLRFDNGSKFKMDDFFSSHGTIHQLSCVETPQQNAVVERKHQHLLNVARALRVQSQVPIHFWGECILIAAHLINRIPTPILSNRTPHEIFFSIQPSYSHLKAFGCLAYISTLSRHGTKFDSRASPCIFIGYPFGTKGYKFFNLHTQSVVSRDAVFHEQIFHFAVNFTQASSDGCLSSYTAPKSSLPLPISVDNFSDFPVFLPSFSSHAPYQPHISPSHFHHNSAPPESHPTPHISSSPVPISQPETSDIQSLSYHPNSEIQPLDVPLPPFFNLLIFENPQGLKLSLGTCRITIVSWLLLSHLYLLLQHKIQVFPIPCLITFLMIICLLLINTFVLQFLLNPNLPFIMRLLSLSLGVRLCQLRFQLWRLVILGLFVISHLINIQLGVSGFIKLNIELMVVLKGIRLG
jgi:hypothetical protein